MQNKTEYEIKKLSELNRPQVEQAVAIFVDGFYSIYAKTVSKDKTLLKELFIDAFLSYLSKEKILKENVLDLPEKETPSTTTVSRKARGAVFLIISPESV